MSISKAAGSSVLQKTSKAPFDGKSAKSALGSFMEEYVCANNFFKCELEFNVDPNVPGVHKFADSAVGCLM